MLAAPVLYVTIGLVFLKDLNRARFVRLSDGAADIVLFAFIAASVLCFALAAALGRSVLAESYVRRHFRSMGQAAHHFVHASLLVSSLCELAAVMGLVYYLLTGHWMRMVLLAAASVVLSLVLFPSRTKLQRLLRLTRSQAETDR